MRRILALAGALACASTTLSAQARDTCVFHLRTNLRVSPIAGQPSDPVYVVDGVRVDPVSGQPSAARELGPGERFGITSYNCATCQVKREPGRPAEYSFFTEPVVVGLAERTPVRLGDVVEAVNDQPITTAAGAAQFTNPPDGPNTLTVRRGRDRVTVSLVLPLQPCGAKSSFRVPIDTTSDTRIYQQVEENLARLDELLKGYRRALLALPDTEYTKIRDKINAINARVTGWRPAVGFSRADASRTDFGGRFGFALSCVGACPQTRASDGTTYYRYEAAPEISAVRDGSLAAVAGIKVGDVLTKVDGRPIDEEASALRLLRSERLPNLRLTVRRDGKELEFLLQTDGKPAK